MKSNLVRLLSQKKKTLVMGVLNITPDSFSDGDLYFNNVVIVQKNMKNAMSIHINGKIFV